MKKLLEGMKVLDLSLLLPGPLCTSFLADLGAEVIKIENPHKPDFARTSKVFGQINRGKEFLQIDLQDQAGKKRFLELVGECNVLIEGFRPGVMERLELDYPRLKKLNPRLVYCSLSGYGQTGPYKDEAGHDINYLGFAGVLSDPPNLSAFQAADVAGGSMMALSAILAGYIGAQKTGEGCYLDVAMLDGVLALAPIAMGGEKLLVGGLPNYDFYETKDGKFMALGAVEPHFFKNFCVACGKPKLAKKKGPALRSELRKLFKSKTQKQWIKLLAGRETCCTPVLTVAQALKNEQIVARDVIRAGSVPFPVKISE